MRFMRLSRVTAIGLLFSLALAACVPANAPRSPAELAAAQSAEALSRQGQFDQAAQAWLALATQSRGHADSYRLLAAEAWREEGRLDRAAPVLDSIKRQRLSGDEPLRFDLLLAELALGRHDAATALRLTTQPNVVAPPALQLRLLEWRARAMAASGDRWGAARTRVQMDGQLSGFDHTQNRQQILELLHQVGVESLKQRAAAMQRGDRMLPWVNEALSQLGVAVAQPPPDLQQPVGTLLPGADANVREGYKVPAQVALLLPNDGNYAAASTAIREGFFAAYLDAGRNHAPRPSVRVYDSQGTADGAVKAYQQAVSDGARLVVGPLTRGEVAAVFSQAQLPVPVLALNHPDDKQLPAANASEFGLLPETEGAQAADHMIERSLRQVYVLVSTDDFAQRAAGAFKAELAARGGQLAGTITLPPGVTSYASIIAGLKLPTAPAASAPAASGTAAPAESSVANDAGIFISMRPAQARLLLPQLRIAQVNLPVFATSHVYEGSDDAAANRDLDGVEFCDAPWLFDAQPGLPNRDGVAARLPAARGGAARLFAFGMDAWNLVPYLDWLRAHPGSYVPGASGQLAADQFGRVRRVLIWAQFQNGLARPLGGSLQMDDVPSNAPPATTEPSPASSPSSGAFQPATD
ncbi:MULTISPECIES: penicillin-binding protein activator [unclassified Rhodanobacter]|uniref:penicillin-binding protein activator n=1 Tax=unclassified Rhodanobacter TaxID=2621553 RepID=UPI001BDF53E9|nr:MULTISPECIES: penicillin-binding protein activator [unclassified Rhodanobacter]MBT2143483.1 penicillin-binding protein activator [Rhodanobacter sp. LX-99]MBT2147443.1 penicillin-binding protein activator [Rhodanobacter sp. LX-100]